MYKKTYVVPLQDMMDDFLISHAMGPGTFPNIFTKVPKFRSQLDMYDYIIERLNGLGEFSRSSTTFTTISDRSDSDRKDAVCGMYASSSVKDGYTAQPRYSIWTLIELLIACKLDSVTEGPFDNSSAVSETTAYKRREVLDEILSHIELVFKYQRCSATGRWADLLNDWELSKQFVDGKTQGGGRQLGRTIRSSATASRVFNVLIARLHGTWQFMSAHLLLAKTKLLKIPDELESFFHVLVYLAVRFLPHNLADDLVGNFLHDYFDDYTEDDDGSLCGPVKYNSIKRGVIDLTTLTGTVTVTNNSQTGKPLVFFMPQSATPSENCGDATARAVHPINELITELLEAFQALYARDDVADAKMGTLDDPFDVPLEVRDAIAAFEKSGTRATGRTAAPGTRDASRSTAASASAAKVETHAAMRRIILNYLGRAAWPKLDKGADKKPKDGCDAPSKESTMVGSTSPQSTIPTRSKRGAEDGGEARKFKRVRDGVAGVA